MVLSSHPVTEVQVSGSASKALRVLLIEDNPLDALLIQQVLAAAKNVLFQVHWVDRLSKGLERVGADDFEIILLDLMLPDSQGFDTFSRMQSVAQHIPIVVLTGMDDESLAIKTVREGAQDYITKSEIDRFKVMERIVCYAVERYQIQKELSHKNDLLRGLIDTIPDQIYLKDTASRFILVNPATAAFFGVGMEHLIGKTDRDFFPQPLAEEFLREEQTLLQLNQSCVNREATIADRQGTKKNVLTSKVPLRDSQGHVIGLLGINRDITTLKEAQDAILKINSELEERVAERTAQLRKVIREMEIEINERKRIEVELCKTLNHLKELDLARSEFVSNVSHELKTPLASMRYGIDNMIDGVVGPVTEKALDYLQLLKEDVNRMTKTVEDILDMSRLETGTMQLSRVKVPFERVIRRCSAYLQAQAKIKKITLQHRIPPGLGFVECDVGKMERALLNIIGNAIKFTHENGCVELVLREENVDGTGLTLDVIDDGIGIPPEHLGKVSAKYYRIGEHISGSGLGLFIAKEIIEIHRGRLAIESPPSGREQGTKVSIHLPSVSPPKILLVSNDAGQREELDAMLRGQGFQVITCDKGEKVMDILRRDGTDMVILDYFLSVMDGVEIILRIKGDEMLRKTPVLVVTGCDMGRASMILDKLHIRVLQKPWTDEKVNDYIEAVLTDTKSG